MTTLYTRSATVVATVLAGLALAVATPAHGGGFGPISAGWNHTCAVTSAHGLACWGANAAGQLGDGTTTNRPAPVPVQGLADVAGVSAGPAGTCAVTTAGAAFCWGDNATPQPGASSSTPTPVPGLSSGVASIGTGVSHTCALTTAGAVECWGSGFFGQVGNGLGAGSAAPVVVPGLATGVVALAVDGNHSCAVLVSHAVECWGQNVNGALGDGTFVNAGSPVLVAGLDPTVTGISAGAGDTCAYASGGRAWCWGQNYDGELGNGGINASAVPVGVSGLAGGALAVAAGAHHTCALLSGGARCWGQGVLGQLGDGATAGSLTPVAVLGLPGGIASLTVGGWHSCALDSGGTARCWGGNDHGQLGNGTLTDSSLPVVVPGSFLATAPTGSAETGVTATVAATLTISAPAAVAFPPLAVGQTSSPAAAPVTVTSNNPTGYQLSVTRAAFSGGDIPLAVDVAAAPAGALLDVSGMTAIPVGGGLSLGHRATTTSATGDTWPASLVLGPVPFVAAGAHQSTVTYTVVGL